MHLASGADAARAVQDWLADQFAPLDPSELLLNSLGGQAASWGEPCMPQSPFALTAGPRPLQPGTHTFGPLRAAAPYEAALPQLPGLGSAGLVDACAMEALAKELLDDSCGCDDSSRTVTGAWAPRRRPGAGAGGAAAALRALMPPPPQPPAHGSQEELVRRSGSASTVSTCFGAPAAGGWLERQCASEGSVPRRELRHARSGPGAPLALQRGSAPLPPHALPQAGPACMHACELDTILLERQQAPPETPDARAKAPRAQQHSVPLLPWLKYSACSALLAYFMLIAQAQRAAGPARPQAAHRPASRRRRGAPGAPATARRQPRAGAAASASASTRCAPARMQRPHAATCKQRRIGNLAVGAWQV